MVNYPGTKLLGVAYELKKKMKNSRLCVHVLHKTLNVVISRCCFVEDGKEMYLNVKDLTHKHEKIKSALRLNQSPLEHRIMDGELIAGK